jgi:adenosine deaminase/adenosine deaminase CECR1
MPKEAIYTTILVVPSTEPILEDAIAEDFYLNTMEVYGETCRKLGEISAINKRGELGAYQQIMEKWSIKDYNEVSYPSDKLFFESFEKFSPAIVGHLEKVYWNLRIEQLRKT